MLGRKINLSNWSINLLKEDNPKWYKGYVLNERDDEFYTWAVLGNAFHLMMEVWNKSGDLKLEVATELINQECTKHEQDEEVVTKLIEGIEKLHANLQSCISSFQRTRMAEEKIEIEIDQEYNLKAKIDALHDEFVQDYKTVATFTKEDDRAEKYQQQANIYQYIVWVKTGAKLPCKMTEILKRVPTLSRKTKDILIGMCEEFQEGDEKLKKDEIIAKYRLMPEVHQDIVFERDEELTHRVNILIEQAVFKANWLRSVPNIELVL